MPSVRGPTWVRLPSDVFISLPLICSAWREGGCLSWLSHRLIDSWVWPIGVGRPDAPFYTRQETAVLPRLWSAEMGGTDGGGDEEEVGVALTPLWFELVQVPALGSRNEVDQQFGLPGTEGVLGHGAFSAETENSRQT